MIILEDFIKVERKNNPSKVDTLYRCYCNSCKRDRGYLSKTKADLLCKSCKGKISHNDISNETRQKMAAAKINYVPWNKGCKELRYEVRLKMSLARLGKVPWNKGDGSSAVTDSIKRSLRHRLRSFIKGRPRHADFCYMVGCSVSELKRYLESRFQPGMTWDNWTTNGWHIDHINPLAKFDLTDLEQLKKACHYTNLQPLWARDNLSKGAKINHKQHLYILTGVPASGKTWVGKQLYPKWQTIDSDDFSKKGLLDLCLAATKPILLLTVGVSTFMKKHADRFTFSLIVIKEDEATLIQRMVTRGGTVTDTILRRAKRMESLCRLAEFTGTSNQVLEFLLEK